MHVFCTTGYAPTHNNLIDVTFEPNDIDKSVSFFHNAYWLDLVPLVSRSGSFILTNGIGVG